MGALHRSVAAVAALALVAASTACVASPSTSLGPTPSTAASPKPTPFPTPSVAAATPAPTAPGMFEALDPAAFALEPAAPDGVDGLRAGAVAPKMFGWLAGGGYTYSSEDRPVADAVAWFSPDGLDWERMAPPERACDGTHRISEFLGGPISWAVGECTTRGPDGDDVVPVVWRLMERVTWERVDPRCTEGVSCGSGGVAVVQELTLAEFDDMSGKGWLIGAGFAGSRFSAVRMELDGNVSRAARLPLPAWAVDEAGTVAHSVSGSPDVGWVIAGRTPIMGEEGPQPMPVAWRSRDGSTWSLLDEQAIEALWDANVLQIGWTPDAWFAFGEEMLRSTDLVTWSKITAPSPVDWWNALTTHRDLLIAFVEAPDPSMQLLQSRDGSTWTAIPVPYGNSVISGGSDYESFIVVGSRRPDAGAWRLALPG